MYTFARHKIHVDFALALGSEFAAILAFELVANQLERIRGNVDLVYFTGAAIIAIAEKIQPRINGSPLKILFSPAYATFVAAYCGRGFPLCTTPRRAPQR